MVFSTSVTSSPNESFEAAAGGVDGSGACVTASERTARLTAAAAAADNHQIREGIIGFSPSSQTKLRPTRLSPPAYTPPFVPAPGSRGRGLAQAPRSAMPSQTVGQDYS